MTWPSGPSRSLTLHDCAPLNGNLGAQLPVSEAAPIAGDLLCFWLARCFHPTNERPLHPRQSLLPAVVEISTALPLGYPLATTFARRSRCHRRKSHAPEEQALPAQNCLPKVEHQKWKSVCSSVIHSEFKEIAQKKHENKIKTPHQRTTKLKAFPRRLDDPPTSDDRALKPTSQSQSQPRRRCQPPFARPKQVEFSNTTQPTAHHHLNWQCAPKRLNLKRTRYRQHRPASRQNSKNHCEAFHPVTHSYLLLFACSLSLRNKNINADPRGQPDIRFRHVGMHTSELTS